MCDQEPRQRGYRVQQLPCCNNCYFSEQLEGDCPGYSMLLCGIVSVSDNPIEDSVSPLGYCDAFRWKTSE